MVDDTVQIVLGGALAAGALGSLYVAFTTASVARGTRWVMTGLVLVSLAAAALGGGAREIAFAFLAVTMLVTALFAIRIPSLMHATLLLTVTLLSVAGLFLTLGAEFIAMIQVLVYVGAVITLILFTIMLTTSEEKVSFLDGLNLPPGVSVEKVEDLHTALPTFTGAGPYKDLETTNPRRPQRTPDTMYGVALSDGDYGTEYSPRDKKEAK